MSLCEFSDSERASAKETDVGAFHRIHAGITERVGGRKPPLLAEVDQSGSMLPLPLSDPAPHLFKNKGLSAVGPCVFGRAVATLPVEVFVLNL